jgi:hypothetical protein
MTTNPLTASTHKADDEPMVMVNIDADADACHANAIAHVGVLSEDNLGGDTSESDDEIQSCPEPKPEPEPDPEETLPPAPSLPPAPRVGFHNLGSALHVAIESAEASGRTGAQRKKRAINMLQAMIDDAGPQPGTPDSIALNTFLESEALGSVIDLVVTASRGDLKVNKRSPYYGCAQAISRMARSLFKN